MSIELVSYIAICLVMLLLAKLLVRLVTVIYEVGEDRGTIRDENFYNWVIDIEGINYYGVHFTWKTFECRCQVACLKGKVKDFVMAEGGAGRVNFPRYTYQAHSTY